MFTTSLSLSQFFSERCWATVEQLYGKGRLRGGLYYSRCQSVTIRGSDDGYHQSKSCLLLCLVVVVLVWNMLVCGYFPIGNVLNHFLFFFFFLLHQTSQNEQQPPWGFMTIPEIVCARVLGHGQLRKMLFTAKINPDAFVFVLRDIPQALPQSTTCGMNDTYCTVWCPELLICQPHLCFNGGSLTIMLYLSTCISSIISSFDGNFILWFLQTCSLLFPSRE